MPGQEACCEGDGRGQQQPALHLRGFLRAMANMKTGGACRATVA